MWPKFLLSSSRFFDKHIGNRAARTCRVDRPQGRDCWHDDDGARRLVHKKQSIDYEKETRLRNDYRATLTDVRDLAERSERELGADGTVDIGACAEARRQPARSGCHRPRQRPVEPRSTL